MVKVYIASAGLTRVADHWDRSLTDLAVDASLQALDGAKGIKPEQIIVGNMFSGYSSKQEHLGPLIADRLNLLGLPAYKVEAAAASGGVACNVAYSAIKSKEVQSVLVIGVEKMRDLEPAEVSSALCMSESAEFTQFTGASFASLNAMIARLYMHEFNVSRDQLSSLPVLAHKNGAKAAHAQFKRVITNEDAARSAMVADPLRILDCAPIGDGAAALLLVGEEAASLLPKSRVEVASSTVATNHFSIYEREDMLDFSATRMAVKKALSDAGVSAKDIDFAEVHDAFSAIGALSLEAMGFSKAGEACKDALSGAFDLDGRLPISTFGGLKARGHPVGATGVYQLAEVFIQLSHKAGPNQVKDARIGLTHNVGGVDTSVTAHVLRRT